MKKDGVTIPKVKKSVSLEGMSVKDAGEAVGGAGGTHGAPFAARADTNQDKERDETTLMIKRTLRSD